MSDQDASVGVAPARHIAAMAPYMRADLSTAAPGRSISLAQNESLRPPSPLAIEAAREAAALGARYPDADWVDLRRAIADVHGLDPEAILVGAGSLALISAIAAAYLNPGDAALVTAHGYRFFETATRLANGRVDVAPERDRRVDVDALLAAVTPQTRLVFVANPGNPTGTLLSLDALTALRDALPAHVLLVIDEAYGEFATQSPEGALSMAARGDAVVLRTFSKAYGLAGHRMGWGVFPAAVGREIRKTAPPNGVGVASLAAAEAAMRDQRYMKATVAMTAAGRAALTVAARGLGLAVDDSATNFALLRFASAEAAAHVDRRLREDGVALRGMAPYGLANCLRATIGAPDEMVFATERLAAALEREIAL